MAQTRIHEIREHRAVELAAQGHGTERIAAELGVSRRTAQRLLADPAAAARLRQVQDARLRALLEAALAHAPEALETLRRAAANPLAPAAARVAAARAMLRGLLQLLEAADTTARIAELEDQVEALRRDE